MRCHAVLYALICAATLAAEPVNEDAELTLDLLEFLAEFGDQADVVPVSDDELDDDELPAPADSSKTPVNKVAQETSSPKTVANDSKRGEQK